VLQGDLAATGTLYEKNCMLCHGKNGEGDGSSARVLAPPPANFREARPSEARALEAIEKGVPGSAMPPWDTKLSDAEPRALAVYVRSLYRPEVQTAE
jgi:mono/diheme cytochrome c family protein